MLKKPVKKPKIYHQPEKSFHCGACATATVLHWFGEEPDPILSLYKQLRAEGHRYNGDGEGLYSTQLQSYFMRMDWVAIVNRSGGPFENIEGKDYPDSNHHFVHQKLATWRIIHQMLQDGFLCVLEYDTAASTKHFAVVYDAFVRRNIYWLKVACSSQGYMEVQVESFLTKTGTSQLFLKPHNNEYR